MTSEHSHSAREMIEVLMDQSQICENRLKDASARPDDKGNTQTTYCRGEWDNLICWPYSAPGAVEVKCPDYIKDFNHDEHAKRYCETNGTWRKSLPTPNTTWYDYSACLSPELGNKDDIEEQIRNGFMGPKLKSMTQLYTVGYSFSLVALTFAMIILWHFRRLHCTRNYIHMNLFVSFILRAIVIFVKDHALFIGSGIFDMNSQSTEASLEDILTKMDSQPGGQTYLVGCNIVMTLFHYFVATNYYWILVEAIYLHSLIFVTFSERHDSCLGKFMLIGWVAPMLFVGPWAIVRGTLDSHECWDISISEYKWIYNGPIVVANVVNFLLFLNIIRFLWYKMRERVAIARSDSKRQSSYRKLAKATLVLIPMFGAHAIIFIGMPESVTTGLWWDIRMYFDLFFNSFQGFFVAIIYCFCNGEVQAELKKAWGRFNLTVEMHRGTRERSRSSMSMFTSFASSNSQAKLSVSGQGSVRGVGALRSYCITASSNNNNVFSLKRVREYSTVECVAPLLEQDKQETPACCNVNKTDVVSNETEGKRLVSPATENPRSCSIHLNLSRQEDFEERALELALEVGTAPEYVETNSDTIAGCSSNGSSKDSSSRVELSVDSGLFVMTGSPRLSTGSPTFFS